MIEGWEIIFSLIVIGVGIRFALDLIKRMAKL